MKIIVIGGNGTIGKKVVSVLSKKHEVIVASRKDTSLTVNLEDENSIHNMFKQATNIDAVICTAGEARWAPFSELSESDYYIGIRSKLMGQVNLARAATKYLNPGGSITLTTGILADDPVVQTASAAMVNGAIHSFVKAVALELENGLRINAVSSGLVADAAEKYEDYFPGHNVISMDKMATAYVKSVAGKINGQIIRVYE